MASLLLSRGALGAGPAQVRAGTAMLPPASGAATHCPLRTPLPCQQPPPPALLLCRPKKTASAVAASGAEGKDGAGKVA